MRINPFMMDALIHVIEEIADNLESTLPGRDSVPEDDDSFVEAWIEGLREDQERDCEILLHLLRNRKFGRTRMKVNEDEAEGILRACSAIRLKIRDGLLRNIPETDLELGEIDMKALEPEQQRGYAVYLFLASLQALLIEEMDPGLEDL